MQAPMTIEEFSQTARGIESEVRRVIVGQEDVIRSVLICVLAGRHALLEGVPGLGKTQLIRTLADVLDLKFSRIQFTPDLMPADIVGTEIVEDDETGRKVFRFREGPVFANLLLADEINRASPKTQSALLEVMQEQTVTVAGRVYRLEPPFFVMATQNPLEMEGTYPLPEAQLDRFLFKIDVRFPTVDQLVGILERTTSSSHPQVQRAADGKAIVKMGTLGLDTPIASHINRFVAQLIVASHPDHPDAPELVRRYVRYGASPRGAQALIIGAKLNALLEGRFNVAYEDVKAVATPALRHRVLPNFEGLSEGVTPDEIVRELFAAVEKAAV
ncbi:MAG: AAA family ATPase [Anaerolineae bacterium]|nr:AAA family ATPase [Anaerolineae bacterium]